MNYLQLLAAFDNWSAKDTRIEAAAIVGSYARGNAHSESDVDLIMLSSEPEVLLTSDVLQRVFPDHRLIATEQWGPVSVVRLLCGELEVELGACKPFWAGVPVDPGTANVVAQGMTILLDRKAQLSRLSDAVANGDVVSIRTHQPEDAAAIADLFYHSVHSIDPALYSSAQKQAWAAEVDAERIAIWQQRIERSRPFIAEYNGHMAGFVELDTDGYIDCFYLHPDAQGKGIAGQLYQYVVNEARGFGIERLYADVSLAAEPFFRQRGFAELKRNQVTVAEQTLENITMEKFI